MNWHTKSQGPMKKCSYFIKVRIHQCPVHTVGNWGSFTSKIAFCSILLFPNCRSLKIVSKLIFSGFQMQSFLFKISTFRLFYLINNQKILKSFEAYFIMDKNGQLQKRVSIPVDCINLVIQVSKSLQSTKLFLRQSHVQYVERNIYLSPILLHKLPYFRSNSFYSFSTKSIQE